MGADADYSGNTLRVPKRPARAPQAPPPPRDAERAARRITLHELDEAETLRRRDATRRVMASCAARLGATAADLAEVLAALALVDTEEGGTATDANGTRKGPARPDRGEATAERLGARNDARAFENGAESDSPAPAPVNPSAAGQDATDPAQGQETPSKPDDRRTG